MSELSFELRNETLEEGRDVPAAAVFVDGAELCSDQGVGPYPSELLGQLSAPMPARVQVRICGCGEAGCWSRTARVRRHRDKIVWDDWREGVEAEDGFPLEPVAAAAIRFDVQGYDAAVAALGKRWEAES